MTTRFDVLYNKVPDELKTFMSACLCAEAGKWQELTSYWQLVAAVALNDFAQLTAMKKSLFQATIELSYGWDKQFDTSMRDVMHFMSLSKKYGSSDVDIRRAIASDNLKVDNASEHQETRFDFLLRGLSCDEANLVRACIIAEKGSWHKLDTKWECAAAIVLNDHKHIMNEGFSLLDVQKAASSVEDTAIQFAVSYIQADPIYEPPLIPDKEVAAPKPQPINKKTELAQAAQA